MSTWTGVVSLSVLVVLSSVVLVRGNDQTHLDDLLRILSKYHRSVGEAKPYMTKESRQAKERESVFHTLNNRIEQAKQAAHHEEKIKSLASHLSTHTSSKTENENIRRRILKTHLLRAIKELEDQNETKGSEIPPAVEEAGITDLDTPTESSPDSDTSHQQPAPSQPSSEEDKPHEADQKPSTQPHEQEEPGHQPQLSDEHVEEETSKQESTGSVELPSEEEENVVSASDDKLEKEIKLVELLKRLLERILNGMWKSEHIGDDNNEETFRLLSTRAKKDKAKAKNPKSGRRSSEEMSNETDVSGEEKSKEKSKENSKGASGSIEDGANEEKDDEEGEEDEEDKEEENEEETTTVASATSTKSTTVQVTTTSNEETTAMEEATTHESMTSSETEKTTQSTTPVVSTASNSVDEELEEEKNLLDQLIDLLENIFNGKLV